MTPNIPDPAATDVTTHDRRCRRRAMDGSIAGWIMGGASRYEAFSR
jgi:hypothetical protein